MKKYIITEEQLKKIATLLESTETPNIGKTIDGKILITKGGKKYKYNIHVKTIDMPLVPKVDSTIIVKNIVKDGDDYEITGIDKNNEEMENSIKGGRVKEIYDKVPDQKIISVRKFSTLTLTKIN